MEMGKVKCVFLLIVLHVSHIQAVFNTDYHVNPSTLKHDIDYDNVALGGQALVHIERRLSILESDNHRLTNENHQIQITNRDLKEEMQYARAENQEMKENVRLLETENHRFMQVIQEVQAKLRFLVEENQKMTAADRRKRTGSDKMSKNIIKSKDAELTAKEEIQNFTNSSTSVPRLGGSIAQHADEILSSDHGDIPDKTFNVNLEPDITENLANALPSMLVQIGENERETDVHTPRTIQREIRKDVHARVPTTGVAFHTRLSATLNNPGDDQPIIMSNVLTNDGAAYDSATGHFTCPVSGVYAFFVTVVSYRNKLVETQLVKNGQFIGAIVNGNADHWGSSSNMVIVTAQTGDHVWLKFHGSFHDTGSVLDGLFTTFSGFLLSRS